MQQIKIRKIRVAYKNADDKGKALLEAACGSVMFTDNVMNRVTTLREACEECGKDYDIEFSPERIKLESPDESGYRELKVIFEALNEGEEIDFYNSNQKKFYGWLEYISGRGLALCGVCCARRRSNVDPRLCTINEKLYKYAFSQFPDSFNKFFLNQINK
jgi:hypothetical protein